MKLLQFVMAVATKYACGKTVTPSILKTVMNALNTIWRAYRGKAVSRYTHAGGRVSARYMHAV